MASIIKTRRTGYWLTTHYPHQSSAHPWSIYLKNEYKNKADDILPGDKVLFYELKGKSNGRQQIVASATVAGSVRENRFHDSGPDIADQRWEWEIPCSAPNMGSAATKHHLYEILNWPVSKPMQIRGGIFKLTLNQFNAIEALFGKQSS